MTEIAWVDTPRILADEEVERIVRVALERGRRPGIALEVTFVTEERLTEMHGRHLGDPTATDVLSFDLGEGDSGPAGELYVSADRARAMADERGVPLERELALYVVHGVLHLCGFDDVSSEDRRRMREVEREVLDGLGFPPDLAPHDVDE